MESTHRRKRPTRRKTKDRVLQARIPEQLDEELRGRAEALGMSVSTIVRNVLLNTFDLVEGVVSDGSQIAKVFMDRPPAGAAPPGEPAVVGWQEAVLNQNGVCDQCNAILPKGERAAIGVPTGARTILLCVDCLGDLSAPADEATPAPKKTRKAAPARKAPSKKAE